MATSPKKNLSVGVHPRMRDYLDQMADEEDISLSEAIRELMERGKKDRDRERSHELPMAA